MSRDGISDEGRFEEVLKASGQIMWSVDEDGVIGDVSGATREVLGYAPEDLIGRSIFEVVYTEDAENARENFQSLVSSGGTSRRGFEIAVDRPDGGRAELRIGGIADGDGRHGRVFIAIASDISEQREAERELEREQTRFTRIFEDAPGGILLLHLDSKRGGLIRRANREACRIARRREEEMVGEWLADGNLIETSERGFAETQRQAKPLRERGSGSYTVERRLKLPDGSRREIRARVSALEPLPGAADRVEQPINAIVHFEDITEQVRVERELRHMARHDPLTDLLNRRRFTEVLTERLRRGRGRPQAGALLLFDLDSFKAVNDTHGHHVGDQALRAVARRIREGLRDTDPIARIGGDEFAALLPRADRQSAEGIAGSLAATLLDTEIPVGRGEEVYRPAASIGVVMLADTGWDADRALRMVDDAMYSAKAAGGGRYWMAPERELESGDRL